MDQSLEREIRRLYSCFHSPEDRQGRSFVPLADAYRRAGDLLRARLLLEEGLRRHPGFSSAHVVAMRIARDVSDHAGALAATRRVLELDPDNVEAQQVLARVGPLARDAGSPAEAGSKGRADAEVPDESWMVGDAGVWTAGTDSGLASVDPVALEAEEQGTSGEVEEERSVAGETEEEPLAAADAEGEPPAVAKTEEEHAAVAEAEGERVAVEVEQEQPALVEVEQDHAAAGEPEEAQAAVAEAEEEPPTAAEADEEHAAVAEAAAEAEEEPPALAEVVDDQTTEAEFVEEPPVAVETEEEPLAASDTKREQPVAVEAEEEHAAVAEAEVEQVAAVEAEQERAQVPAAEAEKESLAAAEADEEPPALVEVEVEQAAVTEAVEEPAAAAELEDAQATVAEAEEQQVAAVEAEPEPVPAAETDEEHAAAGEPEGGQAAVVEPEEVPLAAAETEVEQAAVTEDEKEQPPTVEAEEEPPVAVEARATTEAPAAPEATKGAGSSAPPTGIPFATPADVSATVEAAGIYTRTMGQLYEQQGLHAQAIAVYERLIESEPDDEALASRLERLRGQARDEGSRIEAPGPGAVPPGIESTGTRALVDDERSTVGGDRNVIATEAVGADPGGQRANAADVVRVPGDGPGVVPIEALAPDAPIAEAHEEAP